MLACAADVGNAFAVGISGQGSWETTLQARDLNVDGAVDAYFDTELGLTWLGEVASSRTSWAGAGACAASFHIPGAAVATYGWRLPSASFAEANGCTSLTFSAGNCSHASEMAHLFYSSLGNVSGGWVNTGGFVGLRSDTLSESYLWTGNEDESSTGNTWSFFGREGLHVSLDKRQTVSYMLIYDGDALPPIPEPETCALMLAGLAVVGATARRRKAQ